MSLTIKLFQFSKKLNSTAVPIGSTPSVTYADAYIIDQTDIVNPSIRFMYVPGSTNPTSYNYAQISEFSRYYFIDSWRWTNDGWIADMTVDALASFKSAIGALSLYIERASASSDGRIIDTFYPAKTEVGSNIGYTTWQSPFQNSITTGCFVIGVTSKDAEYGSIAYYALSYTNMKALCAALMDDTILSGFTVSDASTAMVKTIVDPLQYIKSCVFIPLANSVAGNTYVTSIKIWDWEPQVSAYRIDQANPVAQVSATLSLSDHPQITRGVYMNAAPFTRNELFIPTAGKVDLDTTITLNHKFLNIVASFDVRTGDGRVRVKAGTTISDANYILGDLSTSFGVPIQLSQVVRDYIDVASNTLGVIGDIFSGNWGDAFRSAGNAIKSQAAHPSSVGSNGSLENLFRHVEFQQLFSYAVDDDVTHNGRPYCKVTTPATLASGYMIAQKADISITNALAREVEIIKDYLVGGFYYE